MFEDDSSPRELSHDVNAEKLALRSALAHAVGSICEQERGERGLHMDPNAVSTLSFVVEEYMKILSVDLPAFAKHAKRSIIHVDDVLLMARACPDVAEKLQHFIEAHELRPAARKKGAKSAKVA